MRQARIAIGLLLAALLLLAGGPGFRSRKQFEEHFAKHGSEFGRITPEEYLHLAQELRDAPAGGPILEIVKRETEYKRESLLNPNRPGPKPKRKPASRARRALGASPQV